MDYIFREAIKSDKAFLLNANKEINGLSGLDDSTFEKNIDKDLFEDRICKSLIVEENGDYQNTIGLLYGVAYTIKMSYKGTHKIDGFFEYVVPPLEGFWWQDGMDGTIHPIKKI